MAREPRVGETKATGFQIGARRTIDAPAEVAWGLLLSHAGTKHWLGPGTPPIFEVGARYRLKDGSEGEVRVVSKAHVRLTWKPRGWTRASTVQVRVLSKAERCVVAFHQEHLPGPEEREERRSHYLRALEAIGSMLESR